MSLRNLAMNKPTFLKLFEQETITNKELTMLCVFFF